MQKSNFLYVGLIVAPMVIVFFEGLKYGNSKYIKEYFNG